MGSMMVSRIVVEIVSGTGGDVMWSFPVSRRCIEGADRNDRAASLSSRFFATASGTVCSINL